MNGRDLVDVEVSGMTLRTTDIAGNVVSFDLTGWDRLDDAHEFDEPIDDAVVGRVSEIRYDLWNILNIERLDDDLDVGDSIGKRTDGMFNVTFDEDVRLTLPEGEYFCRFEADIFTRLRFDGAATIRNRSYGKLTISFSHPTPVTFGFKSTVEVPRHRLTVEPTTEGIATAISHMASSVRTTAPDRVHRNYRGYPPVIEIGDETSIPEAVREASPETGIELVVPDRLDVAFAAAPLVYYLGARLRPADVTTPVLRADAVDLRHELAEPPAFGRAARDVLSRTFFLDLMASWTGEEDPTVRAYERLVDAGIELDDCAEAPLAERVAAYLELPSEPVDDVLPSWPYRMTVDPKPEFAPVIPHVLHDLAAIDVPGDRTGRAGDRAVEDSPAASDDSPLARLTARKELHGRVGDVAEPARFTALPVAYENRLKYLERDREALTVTVVLGDGAASGRVDELVEAYATRNERISPIVDRYVEPSRDELAAAFAEGSDFLHYVGACEDGGIACRDGVLRPSSLAENNVMLAQLDGPGSRAVANALVETGSVAAVARPDAPSDAVSTTVGQLLLYGQSVATAASCGSLGRDGSPAEVIGDGAHRFVAKWRPCSVQALTDTDGDRLRIAVVPFPVDPVGTHWMTDRSGGKHLMPATYSVDVEPSEFNEYFSTNAQPIFVDGRFYWMNEQKQLIYPIA